MAIAKSYQVTQIRYEGREMYGETQDVWDAYPILFDSLHEARASIKRDGLSAMFQQEGDYHYIAELEPYRDGVSYTGRQFPIEEEAA